MAPKRAQNPSQGKAAAPSRSKTQPTGKAKAVPKTKGSKPAAKSIAVPKSAPRTKKVKEAEPEMPKAAPQYTPSPVPQALLRDVEAEVKVLASLESKEAQLEEALRKGQELESVAQAERSRALEAEKRAAAAEAFVKELRDRASKAEALQLEVAQAKARAAHAEAKAEVLSEMQESFQRNVPEMVRSIAESMMACSKGRRNQRSLGCAPFRGVKPKLELEDTTTDILPFAPIAEEASDELLKFYGANSTEEIPSSADTNQSSSSQPEGGVPKAKSSRLQGVAGVIKRAVGSG